MSCGPLPPLQRRAAPQRRRPLLAARCDAARPSMAHAARPQSNLQATCASLSRYSGCAPAAAPPNLSRSERRSAEAPRPLAETRSDRRQQHHGEAEHRVGAALRHALLEFHLLQRGLHLAQLAAAGVQIILRAQRPKPSFLRVLCSALVQGTQVNKRWAHSSSTTATYKTPSLCNTIPETRVTNSLPQNAVTVQALALTTLIVREKHLKSAPGGTRCACARARRSTTGPPAHTATAASAPGRTL